MVRTIRIQSEPFDVAAATAALTGRREHIGAVVAFTGLCRDEGGKLSRLELEHYPGMAEAELDRIAADAEACWPLLGLTVIHRFGMIHPEEEIVLVLTASAHRRAAFEAAEFLMDYLKTGRRSGSASISRTEPRDHGLRPTARMTRPQGGGAIYICKRFMRPVHGWSRRMAVWVIQ
jgi:molybdopterin synthase catalytic subunit